MEKPDTNTAVVGHADSMYQWSDVTRMALSVCGLPPQTRKTESNHKKDIKSIPTGDSTKYLTSTPQNCQCPKNKVCGNVPRLEEIKKT